MTKKILSLALAAVMALGLMACGSQSSGSAGGNASGGASASQSGAPSSSADASTSSDAGASGESAPETVTITTLDGSGQEIELEVPYNPQRIAILDMACLDILDALGVGDRVVGTASTSLEYLQSYINDSISNLGTIKEADLEAVMACEPDVIFIGGRLSASYDALSEIAPVVYLATDSDLGVVESVRQNTRAIASLFGLEDTAGELMTGFDSRVAALASFSEGRTAIVWAWLPAAASMCWATTAAAPSSAGKRALPTWGRTPSPAPPPTATRPASSSSWTRTPTISLFWTGMPPLAPTGPSWPRKWWRTS